MFTNENYLNHDSNFEDWCSKWEKAQEDGLFDDAQKAHVPTPNMADHSYFGPNDTHPTDSVKAPDAEYWNQVYDMSKDVGPNADPIESGVLSENRIKRPDNEIIADKNIPLKSPGWGKDEKDASVKIANAIASSPNPIKRNTIGKDQALIPSSLSHTFDEHDLDDLVEMKLKLHDLENSYNSNVANVESTKKYETQIVSLKQKIDELSDAMTKVFPKDSAP